MEKNKREIKTYFSLISLGLIGVLFVLFPVFFLSSTTDAFILPKELLLISITTLAFLFFLIRTIIGTKLVLRTSPLNLPIALFTVVVLLSAVFSVNRYDALIAAVPVLFLSLLYFVIINIVRNEKQLLFLLSALTLGAGISALLTILSFMKIYMLPFQYTHVNNFTTFGSLLDQAIYMALVLPIAGYFGYSYINAPKKNAPDSLAAASEGTTQKKSTKNSLLGFGIAFFVIAIGLGLSVYMLMTTQKPLILPFDTGLQTGMSAISQSAPNIFKNILLGSGLGTYINDFTQFRAPSYNNNPALWAFTFFRSSSLVLELLATTGLLGIASFGFLVYRLFRQKSFFLPLVLAIIAAFVLPFSFTLLALLFILIALYDIVIIHSNPSKYGDSELRFVPLNKGMLKFRHTNALEGETRKGVYKIFPLLFTILSVALLAMPLYFITRFTLSDMIFQQSLIAASQNNATETYNKQANAITVFPYRDIYYRAFSQTNLAIANALATNQAKEKNKDEKVNKEIQKNILTLIQQSINAGRTAVTIAPATSFNWNNLSGIYRSLIGFGENADKFAIITLNQAIALDSSNPQQYIDLGGVYYQLGKFDEAIKNFETAVNLKKDYANAYYNLGHAYEEKGQYDQASEIYETVKKLVADNPENVKKINADIEALNKRKAGQKQAQEPTAPVRQPAQQEAIDVNKAQTQLPERNPREQIPGPSVSPAATNEESPVQTSPSGTSER